MAAQLQFGVDDKVCSMNFAKMNNSRGGAGNLERGISWVPRFLESLHLATGNPQEKLEVVAEIVSFFRQNPDLAYFQPGLAGLVRLVLGWVTVSGFNSRCGTFISVCNQPPRSTEPGHPFVGRRNEYQPKGGDTLRLGSKGSYGSCVGGR